MKKVLVIGSTVVDVVVNLVDHLPKTGEDEMCIRDSYRHLLIFFFFFLFKNRLFLPILFFQPN